jgi:hypothetical protein
MLTEELLMRIVLVDDHEACLYELDSGSSRICEDVDCC